MTVFRMNIVEALIKAHTFIRQEVPVHIHGKTVAD